MIDLYMIRHAESVANMRPELICGQSSATELSELGERQAEMLGVTLREAGIKPDVVYISPTLRARRTAEYCLKGAGIELELIEDARLHEVSQGDWEGAVRAEKYTPQTEQLVQRQGNDFKAPGGESINEVSERAFEFLNGLAERYDAADRTTVFVIGHAFITRIIAGRVLGWTHQQTREYPTPNTSITLLQHDGADWDVAFVGSPNFAREVAGNPINR